MGGRNLALIAGMALLMMSFAAICRPPRHTAGAGFAAAFSMVEQALELSPLDHAEAMGLETWEAAGSSGTIAGYKGRKVCTNDSM